MAELCDVIGRHIPVSQSTSIHDHTQHNIQ